MPDFALVDKFNAKNKNTLMETLGIEFTLVEKGHMEATMPVDSRHHQPYGLMHGGASLALAETVGSSGSAMYVDIKKNAVVGIQMSCNHLRGVKSGTVTAVGKIIHAGRSTHLWDIEVFNEDKKLVSTFRLTNFIKPLEA
tara:strand:+ start:160496 stop:160915 length:420 start_codon:yes stop_codon:yes gene_type:complete